MWKLIPYSEWKERLVQADQNNALKLLESLFFEEKTETESISRRYADMEAIYDVTGTSKGPEGTGISCAPVNKELMFKNT